MSKPFDNTLNTLVDGTAADWAAHFAEACGIPPGPLTDYDPVRDGNLSNTAFADKVFLVNGLRPAYVHMEFQSGSELGLPDRMQLYNTVLKRRRGLPVYSVLLLLRRPAVASDQTGILIDNGVNGELHNDFRYTVLRVWEQPADRWLNAGIGLAPLALLTDEAGADLPAVAGRLQDRLRPASIPDSLKHEVLTSAFVLGGLRYDQSHLVEVFTRMSTTLEDSTTYQWIMAKGEARGEARGRVRTILHLGAKRLGEPEPTIAERLSAVSDVGHLERIADRVFDAVSWDDLLGTP